MLKTAKEDIPLLMLAMSLDIGGAETHVVGLARALKRLGWNVSVASNGGRRVRELEEAGISHILCPLHSRSPMDMFKAYKILWKVVDEENIKLIHAHARIPAWIGQKIAHRRKIPLVTTYHYPFVSGFPWNLFTKAGDLTIAVSDDLKEYVIKEFGFQRDKIHVIANGIDLDIFAPRSVQDVRKIRETLGVSEKESPILVYASRLQGTLTDSALTAIDAVCDLHPDYPNIVLFIAGDGEGFPAVKEKCARVNEKLGREAARPLGFVIDMAPLYAASDLVLGMSRVALEAMASQKPVVIFGPEGIYGPVSSRNVDALEGCNYTSRGAPMPARKDILEENIKAVLSDPGLCRQLGEEGRRIVMVRHSMDKLAKDTEEVYLKALSSWSS